MTTLKIGQTVFTSLKEEGVVISINGMKAVIDFKGTKKTMLTMLLKSAPVKSKVKSYMKDEKETKETFNSVVSNLEGDNRNSMFGFADIYSKIEKLAFKQDHFAGEILEKARKGKYISKKQAYVVAYFAKENGLI